MPAPEKDETPVFKFSTKACKDKKSRRGSAIQMEPRVFRPVREKRAKSLVYPEWWGDGHVE